VNVDGVKQSLVRNVGTTVLAVIMKASGSFNARKGGGASAEDMRDATQFERRGSLNELKKSHVERYENKYMNYGGKTYDLLQKRDKISEKEDLPRPAKVSKRVEKLRLSSKKSGAKKPVVSKMEITQHSSNSLQLGQARVATAEEVRVGKVKRHACANKSLNKAYESDLEKYASIMIDRGKTYSKTSPVATHHKSNVFLPYLPESMRKI
jgi:hypothetical protein